MFEDIETELVFQTDDTIEEYTVDLSETDAIPPVIERLCNWLDMIDN